MVVEQPEHPIALNVISTTKRIRGRTMRLEGFILQTLIQVFIDSSADQSFLNPQVAARLGLSVDPSRTEAVMVATSHCFRTKGVAPQFSVRLQGYTFTCDFHFLAVTGCDMVL